MTRIAKLNERLRIGDRLSFKELQLLLERYGYRLVRVRGSHHVYKHPKVPRPLPIEPLGKDARQYQTRQFLDMIETYGLKLDTNE